MNTSLEAIFHRILKPKFGKRVQGVVMGILREATSQVAQHPVATIEDHPQSGWKLVWANGLGPADIPVGTRLFLNPDPSQVSYLESRNEKLKLEVERLRADVETMRGKNNEYWHETETLRAQLATEKARGTLLDDARIQAEELQWSAERKLAERDALLREIHDGALSGFERYSKIEALLSASAEPAKPSLVECDACPTSGGCLNTCMKAPAQTAAGEEG